MRHSSALSSLKIAVAVLLLNLVAGRTNAQIQFTNVDWTLDRGSIVYDANFNGVPLREGYNDFTAGPNSANGTNDPGHAVRRWVWPDSVDIAATSTSSALYVDNPHPGVNQVAESNGQQANDALAFWINGGFNWVASWNPPANVGFLPVFEGGFSYTTDPTKPEAFDYGYTTPTQHTFADANGNAFSVDQLSQLPYVPHAMYAAVHNDLIAQSAGPGPGNGAPTAVWTMGTNVTTPGPNGAVTTQVPAGNYSIDIWSPGDGSSTGNPNTPIAHPNIFHVLVRVSWKNTVINPNTNNAALNYGGPANAGGIDDPVNSRIYMVDFTGAPGWRHIAPGATATSNNEAVHPAVFPYDGVGTDQITVTLYTLTPDNLNDPNLYGNPPLITADAVRFVPVNLNTTTPPTQTPLGPISASGRILASATGTNKVYAANAIDPNDQGNNAPTPAQTINGNPVPPRNIFAQNIVSNVYYVAREEEIPNPNPALVPPDPTQVDLLPSTDADVIVSEPVFYCLDNENELAVDLNGNALLNGTNQQALPSKWRVRWRYEGIPDLGDGTSVASPLIANVRCRDNKIRPMVFFVSTNSGGSLGHIYAFDPVGNNPYDNFNGNGVTDPGDLSTRTTTAYWTYPSYRPTLTSSKVVAGQLTLFQAPNEPPNPPAQWEDYNFTLPAATGIYSRAGYVQPANWWAPDQQVEANHPGHFYYDGDIVPQNSNVQPYFTRGDTLLAMPGMSWAPTLLNDPDDPGGPQILVVTGQSYNNANQSLGGRMYAFDAGGRGDFSPVTLADGITINAPGTTQRIWTWPHFGADVFHLIYTPTNATSGWNMNFTIQDEAPRGYFGGSPVFDPNYPTQNGFPNFKPLMIGSSDGHVYAVLPFHDVLDSVINNVSTWNSKEEWVYPAEGTQGLQNTPSTLALLTATSGNKYLYFTCDLPDGTGGRIYAIPEAPGPGGPQSFPPPTNTLYWVYPPTPQANLPFPNPGDTTGATAPLFPGFGPSAPIAVTGGANGLVNQYNQPTGPNLPGGLQIPVDMVYAVQNDGTVVPVQADPQTNNFTTNLFIDPNDLLTYSSSTLVTPMTSHLTPLTSQGLFNNTNIGTTLGNSIYTTPFPCAVFSDDSGAIFGVGMTAIDDGTGTAGANPQNGGPGTMLPLVWSFGDSSEIRYAPAMIANAYLVEGDENGQEHAYSVGFGANGEGESVPSSEQNLTNGDLVDIDMRVMDFYLPGDWNNFMLGYGQGTTPLTVTNGNGTYTGVAPNPVNVDGRGGFAADWGETIYVAAAGVYHAMPQDNTQNVYGTDPPTIRVTFTLTQPGGGQTANVTVPAVLAVGGNNLWPGDGGFPAGNYNDLSIWGLDPNQDASSGTANDPQGPGAACLLTATPPAGPANNPPYVYPWVAKYKFVILPDATHPYPPGLGGYRVSAVANIQQDVVQKGQNNGNSQHLQFTAMRMFAGQHDPAGRNTAATLQSPNNLGQRGRARRTYIGNPLGLTVRGYTPNGVPTEDLTNQPGVIGWGGSVENGAADLGELLGNGASIFLPGATNTTIGNDSYKSLYAPLDMAQHNSSVEYRGINNAGNRAPALAAEDRSNYFAVSGRRLQVRVLAPPLNWLGGPSSVMNPLPFDQLPTDEQDTLDYPAIAGTNIKITTTDGTDLTRATGTLIPPTPGTTGDPVLNRVPNPTALDLTVQVPQFQPANVNRGVLTIGNFNFGSAMQDDAGNILGQSGTPILGPINTDTGFMPTAPSTATFPAAGYVAHGANSVQVVVQLPGSGQGGGRGRIPPPNGYNVSRRTNIWRQFITGLAVAPGFQMQTAEATLDFGKLPMGAGYTDLDGNTNFYRLPFEPSGTGVYQNSSTKPPVSPWDSDTLLGEFFRPFTLQSSSNVNLINLRVAKFYGQIPSIIDQDSLATNPVEPASATQFRAIASRLPSDDVGETLMPALLGAAFGRQGSNASGPGLGNIGFISSFDHSSLADAATSEVSLYPIYNPTLDSTSIGNFANAVNALQLSSQNPNTNWQQNLQPVPTLHKPRVGDKQPTTATIPDVPHDFTADIVQYPGLAQNWPLRPEVGITVPMGTPAGNYAGPIIPFEDNEPVQWKEWLATSTGNALQLPVPGNNDGIYNVNVSGQPVEPVSDPLHLPTAKVVVRENRLTEGTTKGSLSQLDQLFDANLANPLLNLEKPDPTTTYPPGFNVQPAVLPVPIVNNNGQVAQANMFLYWPTGRQVVGGPYTNPNAGPPAPLPNSPVSLAYSELSLPYQLFPQTGFYRSDAVFAVAGTDSANGPNPNAQWWQAPIPYPGYQANGQPADYANGAMPDLFPSTPPPAVNNAEPPYVPGTPAPNTVRYGSPAVALANHITGNGVATTYQYDPESYLVWLGEVDKLQQLSAASTVGTQITESRLFFASLNANGQIGIPETIGANFYLTHSYLNDPTLPKTAPKPLLAKMDQDTSRNDPAEKMLYIFWAAGKQGKTSLYYNANAFASENSTTPYGLNDTFTSTGWEVDPNNNQDRRMGDQKLPTPPGLVWASDPYPVFKRVFAINPFNPGSANNPNYQVFDAVDVYYTGVLKNRRNVEVLMTRYGIYRGELIGPGNTAPQGVKIGQLFVLPLPTVVNETLSRSGSTYASRDTGWYFDQAGGQITIQLLHTVNGVPTAYTLNGGAGRYDSATGLLYFDVQPTGINGANGRPYFGGGRMVVDTDSGTVSFPDLAPPKGDYVLVSYTPQVMRLDAFRDDSNLIVTQGYGNFTNPLPQVLQPKTADTVPGDNLAPSVVLDRGTNPRIALTSPHVMFNGNGTFNTTGTPPTDRLWVFYRKSDTSGGSAKAAVFYKPMRLVAKLPYPAALGPVNAQTGQQEISQITVTGVSWPVSSYEVDWVRGNVYFTEADEGNVVTINYTYTDPVTKQPGQSGNLTYRVTWGDEKLTQLANNQTTPETALPTDEAVNEGQVAAVKDPVLDKVWVFWSSTRGGTTDLYTEVLSPQLYVPSTNQR